MKPPPVGILDQLNTPNESSIKLTASIYLPQQSRLVVGRQDGTIIIVPATQTVMLQLLHISQLNYSGTMGIHVSHKQAHEWSKQSQYIYDVFFLYAPTVEWPAHQILSAHRGRVNCLLCPSLAHPR